MLCCLMRFQPFYSSCESNRPSNPQSGDLANSFRLISVVSHIGSSSTSGKQFFASGRRWILSRESTQMNSDFHPPPGHYISDVYDMKKQSWLTYNDLDVSRTQEAAVQRDRDRSGYIFFYMHK